VTLGISIVLFDLFLLELQAPQKAPCFLALSRGEGLCLLPLLQVELFYGSHRMLVRAVSASLLTADSAEILAALRAVVCQRLLMLWTGRQGVDLVDLLECVAVHHSPVVVLLRAFFAQAQALVAAVDFRLPVLAAHALVVPLDELLLAADAEVNLVFQLILLVIIDHEVVLKCVLLPVALEKYRVGHAHLVPHCSDPSEVEPTEEEAKDPVGPDEGVDVDVATVEYHLLCWQALSGNSFDILGIEIGHLEDSFRSEFLSEEECTVGGEGEWQ
jgi:hypothetical protein